MDILQIEGLTRRFGDLLAVNQVSLAFRARQTVAIIGPNGAGKSTLFNLLSGRLRPTAGQVYYQGRRLAGLPPHRIQRLGIGRSFQVTNIFREFTTFENVRLGLLAHWGQCRNLRRPVDKMREVVDPARAILEAVGLGGEQETPAATMSHGDQKRLEIALSLTSDPKLLLLDEPTAGMNPRRPPESPADRRSPGSGTLTVIFASTTCPWSSGWPSGSCHAEARSRRRRAAAIRCDEQVRRAYLGSEGEAC